MPYEAEHFVLRQDNPKCLGCFLSENALTISFPDASEKHSFQYVQSLFNHFIRHPLPCQLDLIPALNSLTIIFDYYRIVPEFGTDYANHVLQTLRHAVNDFETAAGSLQSRKLHIPVCYDPVYAPDVVHLAKLKNLDCEEIAALHTSVVYRVLMLGFLPGFAYMGDVPERLRVNRHAEPRSHVEPGSVGIAGKQTGIYPLSSPGGWFIIGRTPLPVFMPEHEQSPTLFLPGDEVTFYSITPEEFEHFPIDDYNPLGT